MFRFNNTRGFIYPLFQYETLLIILFPPYLKINILHRVKGRNVNWIGHILRRNCLLQRVIEGKKEERIDVTRIR